jgi:hypothetical protein
MSLLKRDKLIGAGVGAFAVIALPYVRPVFTAIGRPLVKASIKQALVIYERGRELFVRMAEGLEDVLAEVRVEAGEAPTEAPREEGR